MRAHKIGFVFQGFHLQDSLSAVDNVANGMLYTGAGARDRRQAARDALERVGLGHRLTHRPPQMSGGERQRVAIARAIAKRPLIVLADEPTGNLDSKSGHEVIDLLHQLATDGATLVLITHDHGDRRGVPAPRRDERRRDRRRRAAMSVAAGAAHIRGRRHRDSDTSRIPPHEHLAVALQGLRSRRLRAFLSALGIAIGIGAMVAVVGVSASSQANLLALIDRLGTNLLTVSPGQTFIGNNGVLPDTAVGSILHMPTVQQAVGGLPGLLGERAPDALRAREQTGGIGVDAADPGPVAAVSGKIATGHFLDRATRELSRPWCWGPRPPDVCRSSASAAVSRCFSAAPGSPWSGSCSRRRSIPRSTHGVHRPARRRTTVPDAAQPVGDLRPRQRRPGHPDLEAAGRHRRPPGARWGPVSVPVDALEARAAAKGQFTTLLLGLGAVALLVGAIGIANIMVISVLERRSEIGLRRALGATKRHITTQFLAESALLAALGGVAGLVLGACATLAYALGQGEPWSCPPTRSWPRPPPDSRSA